MVSRGVWLFVVLVLIASFSAVVLAEDSNGNINIQVTKLDKGFSYLTLALLAGVIIIILAISLVLLLRRRPSAPAVPMPKQAKQGINLKNNAEPGFKQEGYYAAVFKQPKPQQGLTDEKSEQRSFVTEEPKESDVGRYLKEDERIVVNVLKMKHDSCSQATLRVITDFSKARLSRILTELEERGVVYKEPQGRKNIITLKNQ
jgi:hypothetical protein